MTDLVAELLRQRDFAKAHGSDLAADTYNHAAEIVKADPLYKAAKDLLPAARAVVNYYRDEDPEGPIHTGGAGPLLSRRIHALDALLARIPEESLSAHRSQNGPPMTREGEAVEGMAPEAADTKEASDGRSP